MTVPCRPPLIAAIRSGGQTGIDRGALDAAREAGVRIEGWCPLGGWAEDYPRAPGLLIDYPELKETSSSDPAQRTEWNVRDSHVTLLITAVDAVSPGTALTGDLATRYGRPARSVSLRTVGDAVEWLQQYGCGLTVNIAGPRESEAPGIYAASHSIVAELLALSAAPQSTRE